MHRLRRRRIAGSIWRKIKGIFRMIRNVVMSFLAIILLVSLITAGWVYWEFTRVPKVKANTLLVMNMKGAILDGPSFSRASQRILAEDIQTLRGMVNNIRKAAGDPRITGILLHLKSYSMNFSTGQEIRKELMTFKQSGKKLFVFMDWATAWKYSFASIADTIYMSPAGSLYMAGFRMEISFYRKLLDKIGITPEHTYIGRYKTGPQPEMLEEMSDAHREVVNDILDAYYTRYIAQVAEARQVSPDTVRNWIDGGLYTAMDAYEAGMIDKLVYESDLERALKIELGLLEEEDEEEQPGDPEQSEGSLEQEEEEEEEEEEPELPTLNNAQYARVPVKVPGLYKKGEKIALVYASGIIVSGKSTPIGSKNSFIGSDSMTKLLDSLAKDKKIKGIILRLDSPGGGAGAAEVIWHAMTQAGEKKPIIVSMADLAASGGYMISAPADTILAYPLTLTGSIGIYSQKYNLQKLYEMLGIHVASIQRGENAGIFSSSRPRTPGEQQRMEHYLREHYNQFVEEVAQGRDMTFEEVDDIAQGHVWTGQQALENGLVDELGGIDEAIAVIKKTLEIPEDEDVELVEFPRMESPFRLLWQRFLHTQITLYIPDEFQHVQEQLEIVKRLEHEPVLKWFPYRMYPDNSY